MIFIHKKATFNIMAKNKQQSPNKKKMPVEIYRNLFGWKLTKKQL